MSRHEYVVGGDILAARTGETVDEPVVDDLDIADRQQEERAFGRTGLVTGDERAKAESALGDI